MRSPACLRFLIEGRFQGVASVDFMLARPPTVCSSRPTGSWRWWGSSVRMAPGQPIDTVYVLINPNKALVLDN